MYPGPYNFVGNCYAEAGRIKAVLPAHGRTELQAGNLGDCSERRRVDDRPQESGQGHERAACARLARRSVAIIGCETARSVTNGGIWLNAIARPSTCEAS